ncbi:hypothetical protein [Burkholderia cepacia]|uniref:hypothetical protein n=1 Tax=Burkholderia cepacia TaxID=292 RepID=UPI003EE07E87
METLLKSIAFFRERQSFHQITAHLVKAIWPLPSPKHTKRLGTRASMDASPAIEAGHHYPPTSMSIAILALKIA